MGKESENYMVDIYELEEEELVSEETNKEDKQ